MVITGEVTEKNVDQIKFTGNNFKIRNITDTLDIQVELKKQHLKN